MKSCSLPLIFSLSLSESVFISTASLPLCSTYRSISSLSFLIQHPPDCSLCLHASSSFCTLRFSKPQPLSLCLLPALPLLSVCQTLPPLVFHFTLIHNKTGLHLERGRVRPFFLPFLYYFKPQAIFFHFTLRLSQQQHLRQISWPGCNFPDMHFVGINNRHLQWKTSNQLILETRIHTVSGMLSLDAAETLLLPHRAAVIIQCPVITADLQKSAEKLSWRMTGRIHDILCFSVVSSDQIQ